MTESEDRIVYTDGELEAIRKAHALLQDAEFCKKHKLFDALQAKAISKRHLAITALICKSRPEEAARKYIEWLQGLADWGIGEFNEDQLTNPPERSNHYLGSYKLTGRDVHGTCIFWIDGGTTIPNDTEEEKMSIYAGIRYHMAVHSDARTAREGLTFIIDVTNQPTKKVGNERRMQSCYNSYPLRPQHIFIVGASRIVRLAINALLLIGGLVSKTKILRRIKFVTLDEVVDEKSGGTVPKRSLPRHLKGDDLEDLMTNLAIKEDQKKGGSNLTEEQLIASWVKHQIAQIPFPDI